LILHVSDAPMFLATITPDIRVLAATTGIAMLSGLLFGIVPALTASKPKVGSALKDDGITITKGGGRHRLRSALVVAQVAVSLLLIVTAGLFVRSLEKALRVDPGFDAHHLVAATFDLGKVGYSPDESAAFERRLLDEVQAIPGVQSAAFSSVLPLSGRMWDTEVLAEGAPTQGSGQSSGYTTVSSGYLATMGIRLTRGRGFSTSDIGTSVPIAIINERMAQRLWPGRDPLGKRFRYNGSYGPLREVVGVTPTGKYGALSESDAAFFYLPQTQPHQGSPPEGSRSLVVRTATDPAAMVAPLSRLFRTLDPNLPLYRLETYDQSLAREVDPRRAASSMLGVFGGIALMLASIGMYGVTAHGVSLRTREIGIRMSLGARTGDVLSLFVREGVALALVGVVIGLAASAAASKLLAKFLFGLSATDSLTFVAGATVLCAVAAFASFLPARRAAYVDPMTALRYD
jgi:predicted permease